MILRFIRRAVTFPMACLGVVLLVPAIGLISAAILIRGQD